MERVMRLSAGVLALALLTSQANAQMPNISLPTGGSSLSKEEIEKNQKIEDAYKSTLQKLPDQKAARDPWGNVREPPPAQKTKPKSGAK
jgi:hypothetical protein